MPSYEYKVVKSPMQSKNSHGGIQFDEWEQLLNELGNDGWKIVAGGGSGSGSEYGSAHEGWVILMREK
jgi:hypothetical protein